MLNTPIRQEHHSQPLKSPRMRRWPTDEGILLPKHCESNAQSGLTMRPIAKNETTQKTCFTYLQHACREKDRGARCSAKGGGDSARAEGMEEL